MTEKPNAWVVLAARHLDATEGPVQIGTVVDASTRSAIDTVLRYVAQAYNSADTPTAPNSFREAARFVEAMNEACDNKRPCESCTTREDVASELRRVADEEPVSGTRSCGCISYHDDEETTP